MRSTSMGRKSSLNPVRVSTLNRDDKGTARSEVRRTVVRTSSFGASSQIPRPRIRSESSDRASSRPSGLKPGKTATTPVGTLHHDLQHTAYSVRGRSPSAERASGMGPAKGAKKDTRPLSDKTYQASMLARIDGFFRDAQQSQILNPSGSVKPVSLKIFIGASEFLLKLLGLLDPKHSLSQTNYVEELPKIAKKLHYPGTIKDSWLKTANTMHSLPSVLGWLSWLVELCEVKDLASQTFQLTILPFTDAGDGEAMNRRLFVSMLEMYGVWNDGKEEEEKELEDRYIEGIAEQCGFTEEDVRSAQLEVNELAAKEQLVTQSAAAVAERYAALTEKYQLLVSDEAKQLQHLKEQDRYLKSLEVEVKEMDAESDLLDAERAKFGDQHGKLNAAIERQPMSVAQRDDIVKRCTEIQSYIHKFNDHVEEMQREAWTLDIRVSNVRDQFEKAILAFNRDIVVNMADGVNLDELRMPETFANLDIIESLKSKAEAITDLKDVLRRQLSACESGINAQTHRLESLHEKIRILDQEKNQVMLKASETRDCIKRLKSDAKQREAKLLEHIQRLQGEIRELALAMPDNEAIQAELDEAREKLDAVCRRKAHLEQSGLRFFGKFFPMLADHRSQLDQLLEKVQRSLDP